MKGKKHNRKIGNVYKRKEETLYIVNQNITSIVTYQDNYNKGLMWNSISID